MPLAEFLTVAESPHDRLRRKFQPGDPVSVPTTEGPRFLGTAVRIEGRHRPSGPSVIIRTPEGERPLNVSRTAY